MTPDLIRQLDRHLGQPACWFLTVIHRIAQLFGSQTAADDLPRTMLFIKLVEQGSTVLAYPALCRAIERVGQENVYFMVFRENRFILDVLGLVPTNNIVVISDGGIVTFVMDALKGIWKLRKIGIDTTIDMEFFARASVVLAYLIGAKRRVGFHRYSAEGPYRGNLLTHALIYNFYLHTSDAFMSLVEAVDAPLGEIPMLKRRLPEVDNKLPSFVPTSHEREIVLQTLWRIAGRPISRPIVLLNPNTGDLLPLRRWPKERFIELGRRILSEHPEATLVITGAASERGAASNIARAIDDQAVCMAGETTLRELLVLYTLSDILVTNDSGSSHFAALTTINIVTLFGPETPSLYRPLSPRARSICAGLACSPCVNVFNHRYSSCRDNVCMKKIQVEHVYRVVNGLLASLDAYSLNSGLPETLGPKDT